MVFFGTHTLPHHTAIRVTLAFSSDSQDDDGSFVIVSLPLAFLFKLLWQMLPPRMLKSTSEHVSSLLRIFNSFTVAFWDICNVSYLYPVLLPTAQFDFFFNMFSAFSSSISLYVLFSIPGFPFPLLPWPNPWLNFSYFLNSPWDNVVKNFSLGAFHWWIIEILWNMNRQWNVIKARHLAYVPMVKYPGKQQHLWFREKWVFVKVQELERKRAWCYSLII